MGGADPMNGAFDLARRSRAARLAVKVGRAAQFRELTVGVLDYFLALDDVGVFQSHFAAGFEAEKLGRRRFGKIVALDEQFAAERNFPFARVWILGIVDGLE